MRSRWTYKGRPEGQTHQTRQSRAPIVASRVSIANTMAGHNQFVKTDVDPDDVPTLSDLLLPIVAVVYWKITWLKMMKKKKKHEENPAYTRTLAEAFPETDKNRGTVTVAAEKKRKRNYM